MLSQIRQISDGNYNTVFVKNKEQKFNLDKEIHDIECWKQSRNHVYRKEERELLAHLEKLRHQQEYLHHLDEERALHPRGVSQSAGRHAVEQRHTRESRESNLDNISDVTSMGRNNHELSLALNRSTDYPQQPPPPSSPAVSLPPVPSVTDHKALHRTDAYINICVVCQLPRHSTIKHGAHHTMNEGVCCCDHEGQDESRNKGRRFTIASLEEHHGLRPVPIEVGQRRHSLMMARLNDEKYEYKPHPPDRIHGGHNQGSHHRLEDARRNAKDNNSHNHHDNIHQHHGHTHHHHSNVNHPHSHDHLGNTHHHHAHDHHGNIHHHHAHDHHGNIHHHHAAHDHHGNIHHHHGHLHDHVGKVHHSGNELHSNPHSAQGHSNASQTHGNNPLRHNHHGNQTGDVTHTPPNSPHRSSRHSISHSGSHDPMYSAYHPVDRMTTHGNHGIEAHSSAKRISDAALHSPGNLGTGVQDSNSDTRRRDHELHWDRHQVCKLRGMITDPHYKEQLEVESGKSYPWSSHYNQTTKTSSDEIEDLKNCRYLRFSKLNLESMKENPEEEVEVFEKKESPS